MPNARMECDTEEEDTERASGRDMVGAEREMVSAVRNRDRGSGKLPRMEC